MRYDDRARRSDARAEVVRVRMSTEQRDALRRAADDAGLTVTALVLDQLSELIQRAER